MLVILAAQAGSTGPAAAADDSVSPCAPSGSLKVGLYGGIRADLDWSATSLECDGMPRPNDEGARLRFSGAVESGGETRRIAIIIGLPNLRRGETVRETPANVTIIEENSSRFFNSSAASFCLSDIEEQVQETGNQQDDYLISGVLYCIAPLAELNGSGGVTLTDMSFSGRLDWKQPE